MIILISYILKYIIAILKIFAKIGRFWSFISYYIQKKLIKIKYFKKKFILKKMKWGNTDKKRYNSKNKGPIVNFFFKW